MRENSALERFLDRIGVASELAAILMVVLGILVLVFPQLLAWIVGLVLILVGVVQLVVHVDARLEARRSAAPPPASSP